MRAIDARSLEEVHIRVARLEGQVKALFWINAAIEIPLIIGILTILLG